MVLLESMRKLGRGDQAPDFDLLGIDGERHTLRDYAKEGTLVIFMCNHCPYVKAKIDAMKEIHAEFGERIGMVGINSNDSTEYPEDSYENMQKTAREKGILFDYLVDETQEVAKSYGAVCTPDPFLFDAKQRLVFHGRIDDSTKPDAPVSKKTMIEKISAMLEGKTIEKDFDPSIGCSIKWKKN